MNTLQRKQCMVEKFSVMDRENLNRIPVSTQRATLQTKVTNNFCKIPNIKQKQTKRVNKHKKGKSLKQENKGFLFFFFYNFMFSRNTP